MIELHKTEHGIPSWPEFIDYGDGYVVKGFCRELMDEDLATILLMMACFAGMMVACGAYVILEEGLGLEGLGFFYFLIFIGVPAWCLYFVRNQYGKEAQVAFLEQEIIVRGNTTGRFPVLKDQVVFRMRSHEKVRLRKKVKPIEVEKLQDYGEIVMEYGLQTYKICGIANLQQAQMFTRVLNEGFRRSQAMKVKSQPFQKLVTTGFDPDTLPE